MHARTHTHTHSERERERERKRDRQRQTEAGRQTDRNRQTESVSVTSCVQLSVSASQHSVQLVVRLGRKSQLYQCLVVGPVVLLALLVPCVFLLPADSTAKITLGTLCASGSTAVRLVLVTPPSTLRSVRLRVE